MNSFRVLDLFAGAGGFSWGFDSMIESIQFKVLMAIELESCHSKTYEKNYPKTSAICADIQQVSGGWIVEQMGQPFIVIGGPPCQSFSIQGKRDFNDPRLKLIFEFERIVRETNAPYFLMENVAGLTLREMRPLFDYLCDRFKKAGYAIRWEILNAADYGIPQQRKRVFLMGARYGLELPKFPDPQQKVTVRDALSDLPILEKYPHLVFKRTGINYLPYSCMQKSASEYAKSLRTPQPEIITGLGRTQHKAQIIARYMSLPPGRKDPTTHSTKLKADAVAPTLLAGSLASAHTALRHIHYEYPRLLVPREGARLQSFPDYFEFDKSISIAWNQIGNAVPPLLSRQFAEKFARLLQL